MRHAIICSLFALAACNTQSTEQSAAVTGDVKLENASVAEVARQTGAAAIKMQAGEWEIKNQTLAINFPGMPGGEIAKQGMADALGRVVTSNYCLTQQEVDKPDSGLFVGKNAGACRYSNFTMAGGKLASTMTCTDDEPGTEMVMNMNGSYSPTAYTVDADIKAAVPGMPGAQGMTMTLKIAGRRLGECNPS